MKGKISYWQFSTKPRLPHWATTLPGNRKKKKVQATNISDVFRVSFQGDQKFMVYEKKSHENVCLHDPQKRLGRQWNSRYISMYTLVTTSDKLHCDRYSRAAIRREGEISISRKKGNLGTVQTISILSLKLVELNLQKWGICSIRSKSIWW